MPEKPRLRFDRHELAGAFGDLGTDLPLIVGRFERFMRRCLEFNTRSGARCQRRANHHPHR